MINRVVASVYLSGCVGLVSGQCMPVQTEHYGPMSGIEDVDQVGSLVYAVRSNTGLQVWDTTVPSSPVYLGGVELDDAQDIHVKGDRAYTTTRDGILAFDVQDPTSIELLGAYIPPVNPSDIVDNELHVGENDVIFDLRDMDDHVTVTAVDMSDPGAPVVLDEFVVAVAPAGSTMALDGDYLYVANINNGMLVLNVSNPSSIGVASLLTLPFPSDPVRDIVVGNGVAYIALDFLGVRMVDVSNPASPSLLSQGGVTERARRLVLDDGSLYVWFPSYEPFVIDMSVYDASPAGFPTLTDTISSFRIGPADVEGDHMAFGSNDLAFFDSSDRSNHVESGGVQTGGGYVDVASHDGMLYSLETERLVVLDPSAPNPWLNVISTASSTAKFGGFLKVVFQGDTLYVLGAKLDVFDIADPLNIAQLSQLAGISVLAGGPASDIAVRGDYAYVVGSADHASRGLSIIDITDPSATSIVSTSAWPGYEDAVALVGDTALIAISSPDGLLSIDISNPANPAYVSSMKLPSGIKAMLVNGDVAYIADSDGSIQVVDISDPNATSLLTSIPVGLTIQDMSLDGDTLALAIFTGGFSLYDVSTPEMPLFMYHVLRPDQVNDVLLEGNTLHTVSTDGLLRTFDISSCSGGCNAADLAEPLGLLDFSDVVAFLSAFAAMDSAADLAEPFGSFDFSDVVAFLGAFGAGCP